MSSVQLTVMKGVVLRGERLRFSCMVNGERHTMTLDEPARLMLTERNKPTRELVAAYGKWVASFERASASEKRIGLKIPTIRELITAYSEIAWKRQADPRFRKANRTIETAIKNFGYCLEASGLRDNVPYTQLMDFDRIRKIADYLVRDRSDGGKGLTGTSAWSYISALQSVTAKWTLMEYRDRGYTVESQVIPKQTLFGRAADPKQYQELPRETVNAIWEWYLGIQDHHLTSYATYAILMLELAIRPSDIRTLTAENFPLDANGHHRLCYKPNKTRDSSNRRVDIEIPDALWERLYALKKAEFDAGDVPIVPCCIGAERAVNASLRKIPGLADKNKASYELRKLCIHTVLVTPEAQGGGIDQAVRLSGDRRDTIEKYYCDPYKSHKALPSQPLARFLGRDAVEPESDAETMRMEA